MDQIVAAVVHEFERVVEACGVRAILVDDGHHFFDVLAEKRARALRLAGLHHVGIAHHRVDLAVVGDETVRVRARPTREGIGRETRVHQRQRGLEVRIVEVREILGKLAGREHALVNHGACRKMGDVVVFRAGKLVGFVAVHVGIFVGDLVVADPRTDALADDVELALKLHGIGDRRILADEDLLDDGFVAAGGFAENFAFYRHCAPTEEFLAFLADDDFKDLHRGFAGARLGRKKREARAIFAFGRQFDALYCHFLAQELVRHLDEQACAIAGGRVRSAGTPMVHVFVHREGFRDDVMGPLAFQVGDEADSAGILFLRRVPKSLGLRPAKRGFLRNGHGVVDCGDWGWKSGCRLGSAAED